MFERFDAGARDLWLLAGTIAAERTREKRGVTGHVSGVEITLPDLRRAHYWLSEAGNWAGAPSRAVARRLDERLPKTGSIGIRELEGLLRHVR